MAAIRKEDYCSCEGDKVPITWLHTCEECGRRYLFPRGRPHVTHPRPFEECEKVLRDEAEEEISSWGRIRTDQEAWRGIWHQMLDAEFCSIYSGFFLLGCGIFCNPRMYGMTELYFTTIEGAALWKELHYKGARYPLDVCKKI